MRLDLKTGSLLSAVSTAMVIALCSALVQGDPPSGDASPRSARPFIVYDNMFYRQKPNTAPEGLVPSNILYERDIWPHDRNYGILPSRGDFEAAVRGHSGNAGPLVLDIERLPLKGAQESARSHMRVLSTLADWAHEAAPGKVIGYYGTNTLSGVEPSALPCARELARHVDAFIPPMYTFDDDRSAWEGRAQNAAAAAHALDPGKPVYFYLWPQYHDGTPKEFQYVDGAFWGFQLRTASRYADGIVLWSPSRYDWSESGWWAATGEFMRKQRSGRAPAPLQSQGPRLIPSSGT